ncbi:MAG TPA: hypothetical protein DIU00_21315 [Phycisphaerales bacterium]|nr:hypothetical protein [Phycisphaerales bacterium]
MLCYIRNAQSVEIKDFYGRSRIPPLRSASDGPPVGMTKGHQDEMVKRQGGQNGKVQLVLE